MKKYFFLAILLIVMLSINFSFAQEDNQTLTISQNTTDEVVSHINETPKSAIQTVKMNGVTNRYNGAVSYSAVFYDVYGNPIKNQQMFFILDSNLEYNVNTDSQGIAHFNFSVSNGNHYLVGYNLVTGESASGNFKVFDVVKGKNVYMYDGDGTSYRYCQKLGGF